MPTRLIRFAAFLVLAVLASAVAPRPAEAFICFSFSLGGGPTFSSGPPSGFAGPWYGPAIGPHPQFPFGPVSPPLFAPGLYGGRPLYQPYFPGSPFFGSPYGWR